MHVNTRYQWFIGLCTLVEFMYLVFTRMPGESYRRLLRSLLLYLCYVFRVLTPLLIKHTHTHSLSLSLTHTYTYTHTYIYTHTHSMYWLVHALDADGQVLGHDTRLDGLYAHCLQRLSEVGQLCIAVQLGSVGQTPRPCENGSCRQPHTNLPFLK